MQDTNFDGVFSVKKDIDTLSKALFVTLSKPTFVTLLIKLGLLRKQRFPKILFKLEIFKTYKEADF